jgi:hypothetical protein
MKSTIPRIPHLPGSSVGPDDLELGPDEARRFLERRSVVSEKTDGISLTVRLTAFGELAAGLKADWLAALDGRVERAATIWTHLHEEQLRPLVADGRHLYGEWMWHRLAVPYEALPAPALFYSIRDERGRLLSRRESLGRIRAHGLPVVEPLFEGVIGDRSLASMCGRSAWSRARAEGLIVEIVDRGEVRWAKWVRSDYRQPTPRDLRANRRNGIVDGPTPERHSL